jgi:hypothetical protein
MESVAATIPGAVRSEFVVTPSLWGQSGVPGRIAAMMVLPRGEPEAPPDGTRNVRVSQSQP